MSPSPTSPADLDLVVVVPAHDAAETLPDQLRALADGGFDGRWQVVVVNDCCRDDTVTVAKATAAEVGLDLRVISTGRHSGPSTARNTGVALTKAPLILFCDADDRVTAGWVGHMADHLGSAAIVTGRLRADVLNDPILASSRGSGDSAPTFIGLFPSVSSGNLGVRRETWDRIGGFDPDLRAFEDAEWASRAAIAGVDVSWAPDAVVDYRYRTAPRHLWGQGRRYGEHRPVLARRWFESTGERAPRLAGLRSWAWLAFHVPDLVSRRRRARWCWVAGNRYGSVTGSIRARFLVL